MVIVGGGFIPFETPVPGVRGGRGGHRLLVYGSIERSGPPWTMSLSARSLRTTMTTAPPAYTCSTTSPSPRSGKRGCSPSLRTRRRLPGSISGTRWRTRGSGGTTRRDVSDRDLHDYALPERGADLAAAGCTNRDRSHQEGPTLRFDIADDVAAASAEGALESCVLSLKLTGLSGEDEMDVWLNGEQLGSDMGKTTYGDWSRVDGAVSRQAHSCQLLGSDHRVRPDRPRR